MPPRGVRLHSLNSVEDYLTWAEAFLRQSSVVSNAGVRSEARLLLAHTTGLTKETLCAFPEQSISREVGKKFQKTVKRRTRHEPISRIIGQKEFWSLPFRLSPATLDPRPDSETLIQTVLRFYSDQRLPLNVLDLGTGTGCLLLSVLTEFPHARGMGVDINPQALEIASLNASNLSLASRTRWILSDWGKEISEEFDLILTNPPYIPTQEVFTLSCEVKNFDPHCALDGGKDGLQAYRTLTRYLPFLLKPQGKIFIEIGQHQSPSVQDLFSQAQLKCLGWFSDFSGIERCGVFEKDPD